MADLRKRMRPAIIAVPQLRSLNAKWSGETISGMTIKSILYDRYAESIVFEIDTDREGVYALLTTDLTPAKREDGAGLQYNLSKAKAVVYNDQNVPKRKVDLSPSGAESYKNVAEFGNEYLRSAMRKLRAAVQGLPREQEEGANG